MSVDVHIKGGAELQQFLGQLPEKLARNILRSALRKGARVVQLAAKARVPVKTGTLRAGLKVKGSLRYNVAKATVITTGRHAYLARWLEYGTQAHTITAGKGKFLALLTGSHPVKSVEHPGIRPRPFMRPALDSQAHAAVAAVAAQIRARLTKAGIDLPDEGDAI